MTNSSSKDSCRDLFKLLSILPLQSQYIYSISVFTVMNRGLFKSNYDIHNVQMRQKGRFAYAIVEISTISKRCSLLWK
jgi:hypothetical protein